MICLKSNLMLGLNYCMSEVNFSLIQLWSLLRQKEKQIGLSSLTLTERDILENIGFLCTNSNKVALKDIIKLKLYPRATIFRTIKTLKEQNLVLITKDKLDKRQSYISLLVDLQN